MRSIEYITSRGNRYRIDYSLVGLFSYKWDILIYENGCFLGLTFGYKRALFPSRVMLNYLTEYAEDRDECNDILNIRVIK